jgi:hypothetical protein
MCFCHTVSLYCSCTCTTKPRASALSTKFLLLPTSTKHPVLAVNQMNNRIVQRAWFHTATSHFYEVPRNMPHHYCATVSIGRESTRCDTAVGIGYSYRIAANCIASWSDAVARIVRRCKSYQSAAMTMSNASRNCSRPLSLHNNTCA